VNVSDHHIRRPIMKERQLVTGICTFRKRCGRRWAARRFGSRVSGSPPDQPLPPDHRRNYEDLMLVSSGFMSCSLMGRIDRGDVNQVEKWLRGCEV
jgi:hypothetical protein